MYVNLGLFSYLYRGVSIVFRVYTCAYDDVIYRSCRIQYVVPGFVPPPRVRRNRVTSVVLLRRSNFLFAHVLFVFLH